MPPESGPEYLVAPCANYEPKPLKVEIRRISVNARLSQEITAFACDIYLDGKKVGEARNDGGGGAHHVRFEDRKTEQLIEAWAKPQVPAEYSKFTTGIEWLIDRLLEAHLQGKADKAFVKKLAKIDKAELAKARAINGSIRVLRYRFGEHWVWVHYKTDAAAEARANADKMKRTVDELVVLS